MKKNINENDLQRIVKKVLNEETVIYESKLSRVWQYIQNDQTFGILSPFRKNYSSEENLNRYKELKNIVRNELNLGYIELEGGFKEEGDWIKEKSLLIPNINKQDLINLGESFEQFSVIYKDKNEFVEIGTNDISGKGVILTDFIKSGWDKNMEINSELTQKFFSRLVKGGHTDKKFIFNLKESFLYELDEKTFNDMYREVKGKSQKRVIKLL